MKYIIVGLGNFGSVLAERFTQIGYDVVGVDRNIERVEEMKSKIPVAICLNITDRNSLNILPLKSADGVIIALGKELGESLTAFALLKDCGVRKIIVRAVSEVHENVLELLGVEHIIYPEKDAAHKYALSLEIKEFVSSYKLDEDTFIVQMRVPLRFLHLKVSMINFEKDYNVKFICLLKEEDSNNLFGKSRKILKVSSRAKENEILERGDIIVIMGTFENLSKLGR